MKWDHTRQPNNMLKRRRTHYDDSYDKTKKKHNRLTFILTRKMGYIGGVLLLEGEYMRSSHTGTEEVGSWILSNTHIPEWDRTVFEKMKKCEHFEKMKENIKHMSLDEFIKGMNVVVRRQINVIYLDLMGAITGSNECNMEQNIISLLRDNENYKIVFAITGSERGCHGRREDESVAELYERFLRKLIDDCGYEVEWIYPDRYQKEHKRWMGQWMHFFLFQLKRKSLITPEPKHQPKVGTFVNIII